jgi:hypothetical protein
VLEGAVKFEFRRLTISRKAVFDPATKLLELF